jgi:hypothetical protein
MTQQARTPTVGVTAGVATDSPPAGYHERKVAGWCTYGACPRRAADGFQLCDRHRRRVNARQRDRAAAVRAELSEQRKCRRCRKPSTTYRCPACRILDQTNLPARGVPARVATDEWRRDANGWERYRGKGQRGAPPAIVGDESDLAAATEALERGRVALVYAHGLDPAVVGKLGKREALAAAASILRLAAVFVADVVERNTGERPVLAKKLRQAVEDEGEDYGLEGVQP